MIEIEGEWDVAPARPATVRRSLGYTAPITQTELVGTVTAISADRPHGHAHRRALPVAAAASAARCCDSSARTARPPTARSPSNTANDDHRRRRVGRRTFTVGAPGLRRRAPRRGRRPRQRPRPRRRHPRRRHHAGRRRHPSRRGRRPARSSAPTATYTVRLTQAPAAGETVTVRLNAIASFTLDIGRPELRPAERLPRAAARVLERLGLGQPAHPHVHRADELVDGARPSLHPRDRRHRASTAATCRSSRMPRAGSTSSRVRCTSRAATTRTRRWRSNSTATCRSCCPARARAARCRSRRARPRPSRPLRSTPSSCTTKTAPRTTSASSRATASPASAWPATTSLAGRPVLGGIRYAQFEDLTILLGYGDDTFTVENTHAGTTTINAGPGRRPCSRSARSTVTPA